MAVKPLMRDTLQAMKDRVSNVRADSERRWGTLDPARMLRHLRFTVEASLGEEDTRGQLPPGMGAVKLLPYIPGAQHLMYLMVFKWFTDWPKGKLKGPEEWFPTTDGEVDQERSLLLQKLDQFVNELESHPDKRAHSPLLGNISLRKWSQVHATHLNHHLNQFGV